MVRLKMQKPSRVKRKVPTFLQTLSLFSMVWPVEIEVIVFTLLDGLFQYYKNLQT